jgi:prepilin-type N-terminal cleavage/methylation domain-containing protein
MKNERGFTIMELLVVIVIIGVLAAIGVPAYKNMTDKARKTACQANQRAMSTAVGMYYVEQGKYPDEIADTTTAAGDVLTPYLDNIDAFKCPGKTATGGYAVSAAGKVTCKDVDDHNVD